MQNFQKNMKSISLVNARENIFSGESKFHLDQVYIVCATDLRIWQ